MYFLSKIITAFHNPLFDEPDCVQNSIDHNSKNFKLHNFKIAIGFRKLTAGASSVFSEFIKSHPKTAKMTSQVGSVLSQVDSQLTQVGSQLSQVGAQLSQVGSQLSQADSQLSQIHSQLSQVDCQVSQIDCRASQVGCRDSQVHFQLSQIDFQLSQIDFQLSQVGAQLSQVTARLSKTGKKISRARKKVLNKSKRNKKHTPAFVNEFITNADAYLHYSNGIIFNISNTTAFAGLIFLVINNSGSVPVIIIILIFTNPSGILYAFFIDSARIFNGVIERYCGVPP